MAMNEGPDSSWFTNAFSSNLGDVQVAHISSADAGNSKDTATTSQESAAKVDTSEEAQALPALPPLSKRFRNFPSIHSSTGTLNSNSVSSDQGSQISSQRPSSSDSRSHVPSITSHAFRRPLSSRKLQAHRGHRPVSAIYGHQPLPQHEFDDAKSKSHRNSTGSEYTIKGGHALPRQEAPAVPPLTSSTFAAFNDAYTEDRTRDPSLAGDFGNQDRDDNDGLLGATNTRRIPAPLDLEKHALPTSMTNPITPISPLSFMSGLREKGREALDRPGGHEKLASAVSSPGMPQKSANKLGPTPDLGRNWEYATGNSIFFCGGRLQNSRDRPISIATALLVIFPACLFFGFSAPWLSRHVSAGITVIFAYLFFLCMSSFFHASFCDAGILPRNLNHFPPPKPDEDPLTLGPSTTRWEIVRSATAVKGAMEVPTKYCKSCNIWRPPRCHHCRVCDNCVEAQDHHCVWLNNCVGRRNYRYFLTFVGTATILGIYLMAASIGHIVAWKNQNNTTMGEAINKWRVPFAMFLYGLLGFPYPASLWCYHILLMGWGRTTREYLNSRKFPKKDRHRPFAQVTMFQNWVAALGRPRPPSYLQFKEKFQEGDQRFGEKRARKRDASSKEQPSSGVELDQFKQSTSAFHPTRLKGLINRTPREQLDYPQLN